MGPPHARGGASASLPLSTAGWQSAPRSWGCFAAWHWVAGPVPVRPTLVGVLLRHKSGRDTSTCPPHARGGASDKGLQVLVGPTSAPRSWGCFHVPDGVGGGHLVRPTLVGVLPRSPSSRSDRGCPPHARGGASTQPIPLGRWSRSAPRSWGCFRGPDRGAGRVLVRPTLVGVLPSPKESNRSGCRPLRVRLG